MKNRKKELRKLIATRKTCYSGSTQEVLPDLFYLLESFVYFQQAKTVLLYHSLPDEVNTRYFIEKWKREKKILLPVVRGEEMVLCPYEGAENCKVGSFGITEPVTLPYTDYEKIDLALIPGVAFDRKGNRLGRGKGYYDRILPYISATKTGICFSFQLLDEIPREPFDVPMDFILTEKELLTCSR
ncbi:MAG: 5-formyltetrahydrofolate cyclo-ligase [Bacteroides sp.]|nr:5-formyltetrahydrofolate cyclo-ligase [Bacteroides sp.]